MLRCNKCTSLLITMIFSDSIMLVAKFIHPGPTIERIHKDTERGLERYTNFRITNIKNLDSLSTQDIKRARCDSCGYEGDLEKFEIVNVCRCGKVYPEPTNQLVFCDNFAVIICPACVDKHYCAECAYLNCVIKNLDFGNVIQTKRIGIHEMSNIDPDPLQRAMYNYINNSFLWSSASMEEDNTARFEGEEFSEEEDLQQHPPQEEYSYRTNNNALPF